MVIEVDPPHVDGALLGLWSYIRGEALVHVGKKTAKCDVLLVSWESILQMVDNPGMLNDFLRSRGVDDFFDRANLIPLFEDIDFMQYWHPIHHLGDEVVSADRDAELQKMGEEEVYGFPEPVKMETTPMR